MATSDYTPEETCNLEGCEKCADALQEAETMAKVTGSVGATVHRDERLVGGLVHSARWMRDGS